MIIQMDIKYFPYVLLIVTLVKDGRTAAFQGAMGIVAAHLYDFLTKYWPEASGSGSFIPTPRFVHAIFPSLNTPVMNVKAYGTAVRPRVYAEGGGTGTGTSTSTSWNARGQGHRLGGE